MTTITTVTMSLLSAVFEHERWQLPTSPVWGAIVYNALLIFGFAQPVWLYLARNLPPIASTGVVTEAALRLPVKPGANRVELAPRGSYGPSGFVAGRTIILQR